MDTSEIINQRIVAITICPQKKHPGVISFLLENGKRLIIQSRVQENELKVEMIDTLSGNTHRKPLD